VIEWIEKLTIAHRRFDADRLVTDLQRPIDMADPAVAALARRLVEAARRLGGNDHA